jgi:hypothetical protein
MAARRGLLFVGDGGVAGVSSAASDSGVGCERFAAALAEKLARVLRFDRRYGADDIAGQIKSRGSSAPAGVEIAVADDVPPQRGFDFLGGGFATFRRSGCR